MTVELTPKCLATHLQSFRSELFIADLGRLAKGLNMVTEDARSKGGEVTMFGIEDVNRTPFVPSLEAPARIR